MTWSELNDWLALYEVDPWGERRADLRHAVNTIIPNVKDHGLQWLYPYSDAADSEQISVEDELNTIELINEMNHAATGTAEPQTDRIG